MKKRLASSTAEGKRKNKVFSFFAKIGKGGELVCFHCKSIKEKVGLGG